jgi:hypothetical protein
MHIAILRPADGYYVGWEAPAEEYSRLFGDALEFRIWSDPGDLSGFDLILPLLAWGYQRAPARWYGLIEAWTGLPFANSLETLRWNTNKSYLLDLEKSGIAIVPTLFAPSLAAADIAAARTLFESSSLVVKPAISGGAEGTYRLEPTDLIPDDVMGAEMLIQPLIPTIADEGEYSLFYFGTRFSHAILKRPAAGDFRVQEQFGGKEVTIDPPAGAFSLAQATLSATPVPLLYARIDMVRDAHGLFRLMELELIEPALYLSHAPDQGSLFANAVLEATLSG